jgi:hypothetical protein
MYRRARERAPAARAMSGPRRQTHPILVIGHCLRNLRTQRFAKLVVCGATSLARVHAAAFCGEACVRRRGTICLRDVTAVSTAARMLSTTSLPLKPFESERKRHRRRRLHQTALHVLSFFNVWGNNICPSGSEQSAGATLRGQIGAPVPKPCVLVPRRTRPSGQVVPVRFDAMKVF